MRRALLIAFVTAAATAPAAEAQLCVAPPGTAAIDEYCELVPGAGGDRPSRGAGLGVRDLPAGALRDLAGAGDDGRLLASALGKPSPDAVGAASPDPSPRRPSEADRDLFGAVVQGAGSGPLAGGGFVALLLTLAAGIAGWSRLERRGA